MSLKYEPSSEPLHIFCEVVVLKLRTAGGAFPNDYTLGHREGQLDEVLGGRDVRFWTCPVQTFGHAGTNLGRAVGREQAGPFQTITHAGIGRVNSMVYEPQSL